jgi:hypothetical protein
MFKKQAQPETILVPIMLSDTRGRADKWTDARYLIDLETMGGNSVYQSEIIHELGVLRDAADKTDSPDFLKGCNVGIAALKGLLVIAEKARRVRARLEGMKGEQDE